ncbi:siderophore-interacting protein [Hathewaya histolytica]|uniref:siderophore-interacting protein n=1 Tax=Hathewaya histolytica TaxID=1498 RepID=UPI003B673CEF
MIKSELKEKARELLNSYLINKNCAEIKELEIQEVKSNYGITGVSIGERTGKTNKVSREIEDRIVNKDYRIQQLERMKLSYEFQYKKVEKAVDILKEFEKDVIVLKYMTSPVMQWRDVSMKLGFSKIACQRAEDRAINKMIPILFC